MSNLLFALRHLDFLTEKPTLYINKMERAKSISGAFLTCLMIILTVFFAIFNLLKLFGREDVDFNITELREDSDASISMTNFPVFFYIRQVNPGDSLAVNDIFTITANLYSNSFQYDNNGNLLTSSNKIGLSFNLCDKANFASDDIMPANLGNYYCLNTNTANLIASQTKESYISISVNLKPNAPGIMSTNYFEFVFGYFNRFIDTHNLDVNIVPLRYSITKQFKLSEKIKNVLDISLINAKYITDNGHFIQDLIKKDMILVDNFSKNTQEVTDGKITEINLRANGFIKKEYSRKFYKAQSFLAEMGGIFNVLYIIAFNFNLIHSVIHSYLTIDKECRLSYYAEKVKMVYS
jgi:hypothetical protein